MHTQKKQAWRHLVTNKILRDWKQQVLTVVENCNTIPLNSVHLAAPPVSETAEVRI